MKKEIDFFLLNSLRGSSLEQSRINRPVFGSIITRDDDWTNKGFVRVLE
jgi:hypothetical protein